MNVDVDVEIIYELEIVRFRNGDFWYELNIGV